MTILVILFLLGITAVYAVFFLLFKIIWMILKKSSNKWPLILAGVATVLLGTVTALSAYYGVICGLYPFRNWPVSALSFGQKKRVTIASVLALDPELILLDEPTAGQDFRHYTDIMEFLRGLNAQGVTVVMITHDMHLMLEYTQRALVFCDGELIADRSAAGVLCDPALIERAALKETSLYTLANRCGIESAQEFVERFIAQDREVRENGR